MKRFGIVLLIRHPSIDPKEISAELKLEPFSSCKAGDQKVTPKGTPLTGIWDRSSWNHVFEYEGDSGFFEETERLLAQFALHKDFFVRIAKEGGYAEIYLQLPGDVNQGSSVKPSVLKLMSELGLHLGAEVFPNANHRNSKDYADVKGITFITRSDHGGQPA